MAMYTLHRFLMGYDIYQSIVVMQCTVQVSPLQSVKGKVQEIKSKKKLTSVSFAFTRIHTLSKN